MNTKSIINTIKSSLDYYEGIGRVVNEPIKFVDNLIPKVPHFVVELYEEYIRLGIGWVIELVQDVNRLEDKQVYDWLKSLCNHDEGLFYNDVVAIVFVRMYLFGYEVMEWN